MPYFTSNLFHPSLVFVGKGGAYSSVSLHGSNLLALLANIRQELAVTNALPYNTSELITTVKSFILLARVISKISIHFLGKML